nr:hypothetical protein TetV2_00183 [Oceanusvirus sp.]
MAKTWHWRLAEAPPLPFVVSKDTKRSDGRWSKKFAAFPDYRSLLAAVVAPNSSDMMYEVIRDRSATPVWFFADHDCATDKAQKRDWTPETFMTAVVRLHAAYFNIDPYLVQACSSCRPGKLSAHVKINVDLVGGLAEAAAHAARIDAIAKGTHPDLAPDPLVYTSNQQIRLVGSRKRACETRKRPWGTSSVRWRDHFVRRADGSDGQTVTDIRIERPSVQPSSSSLSRPTNVSSDGPEAMCVRLALQESGATKMFGPYFDVTACRIEQVKKTPGTIRCNIDGTVNRQGGTLACPYAKRPHSSNRLSVLVTSRGDWTGCVTLWCYSQSCSKKPHIRLAYNMRPDRETAEAFESLSLEASSCRAS